MFVVSRQIKVSATRSVSNQMKGSNLINKSMIFVYFLIYLKEHLFISRGTAEYRRTYLGNAGVEY